MSAPESFEDFVIGRGPSLLRFAYLVTHDAGRAEDLVQEAPVKLSRHWSRLGGIDRPEAYVRKAIAHSYISWRRRRSAHEVPSAIPDRIDANVGSDLAERDQMWRALAVLPRRQQAVLVLRYYEDLPDEEISQVLDCTRSTVRSLAARALRTLRNTPTLRATALDTPSSPESGLR